ncbi:prephenate dehydratase [Candidatus Methanoplasma termitum]|uniref:prephenate dehydratase n=1 Tax=Candidatus Methanoplasma termitum TaxID=1577791 RepID=A0A0A7LEC3_9ARCH|nr:prephenate dehydratase [Candidatus Methanoplasma termitum]AIZ56632.1 prephenate dehydratase [Candidatus Methanoplasma termitum]MCL2333173.1 prephenate dehydratase [Candidatus Methanoplasma sp.]
MKVAYLGPEGTFTEQAAKSFIGSLDKKGLSLSPLASIEDVFHAVETGSALYGVVPVENSIEGAVNTTVDTLIFDSDLFIEKQLDLPITQNLMVGKNNTDCKITKIISHPQALAQSRKFINKHYPDAVIEATGSTSEAAKIAANYTSKNKETIAAIGPKSSAELYDLKIIHEGIQENKSNTTQFILLTKKDTSMPKVGCSTLIVFSTEDKPGELYKILDIFAIWDLNMTKIMSRPTKNRRGEYVFFIELSGYDDASDVADALTMVKRKTSFFKNLGSYQMINNL